MLKYSSILPQFYYLPIYLEEIAWLCINAIWFRFGIFFLSTTTFRGNLSWLCLNIMFVVRCKYVIWNVGQRRYTVLATIKFNSSLEEKNSRFPGNVHVVKHYLNLISH